MKKFFSIAVCLGVAAAMSAATYTPKYELINRPGYETSDLGVATYNALDYNIDNTGATDCTAAVQALLDAAGGVGALSSVSGDSNKRGWYANPTGGVVYLPEGKYLFTGTLVIPRGVTLRGDWKRPALDGKTEGTIMVVQPKRGANTEIEASSLIIMEPSTLVQGLTFWYPDQDPSNIKKYPPSILMGESGYWGNDYCTVMNCTFINSYTGIQFCTTNGGGCPNIYDVCGTPLSRGVQIDCLADVGRFDVMDFRADYWEKSGLEGAPSDGQIDAWLYENATGVVMRRNDWSYTCNLTVEGYKTGFIGEPSASNAATSGNPNGHNYNFNLKDCKNGVIVTGDGNSGIMFTEVKTPGCEIGLTIPTSMAGPVGLYGCDIYGSQRAIWLGTSASPGLILQESKVNGNTLIENGQFTAVNCDFSADVTIAPQARTIFVGNRFSGNASLKNNSLFVCEISEEAPETRPLPEFKAEWMQRRTERPAKAALYVATDPEFGAIPVNYFDDLSTAKDNTAAVQAALDKAGANGGGIVYLPLGHYRMDGTLRIPTGVELKGAGDLMTTPKGNGTILESFHGAGNENADPFISMDKGSGLRGLTINYPNQESALKVTPYPYSVRGNADTYIVNLQIRTAYRGVDLFTNKCDNHYVDYLAGHAFKNVIRVGGNCTNGMIANIQCNTIAYACGDETKFGSWANSMINKDNDYQEWTYSQNKEDLDFMIVGDCKDEILYNNFLFGCRRGMYFVNDGNGGAENVHSLGNAVDGAVDTFVFEGGEYPIDLINSQVVALNHDYSDSKFYINSGGRIGATFVVTGKDFNSSATFFSGNFWGGGDCLVKAEGGTVNIYNANLATSGSKHTILSPEKGNVNLINTWRRSGTTLFEAGSASAAERCKFVASMVDATAAQKEQFGLWQNNLPIMWTFNENTEMLPRTGWKATAFNDENGTNNKARLAIDNSNTTRWSTERAQAPGQWFAVDFGKPTKLNAAILDSSSSPNDGPLEYYVEVFEPDTDGWRTVAQGSAAPSVLVVTFDAVEASKIRINQTGSKTGGGYWSIHEFNIALLDIDTSEVEALEDGQFGIGFTGRDLILAGNTEDILEVRIFSVAGNSVAAFEAYPGVYSLDSLSSGVYVVMVTDGNEVKTLKIRN